MIDSSVDSLFANFHFLRPEWFYALIPLVLIVMLLKRLPKHQADWEGIISPHLLQSLFPSNSARRFRSGLTEILGFCGALCVFAAAGPTFEKLPQPVFSVNEGHVIVMDMSLSMRATDVAPDRLTRAKFKAIDLVKQINEGEIGVVAYAGDAFTISPLTEDISTLEALIPSLSPEIMPVTGSDPYLGLTHAADLLMQAGYPNGKIYWITDGVEQEEAQEVLTWVNDTRFQINVLAIGTQEGAPITLSNGELLKDATGSIVIPKMRFSTLAGIARQSGGNASELTSSDSDIKALSSALLPPKEADEQESNTLGGDQWRELGPWLVVATLPFFAYLFRKGLIAVVLVGFISLCSAPNTVFAQQANQASQNDSSTISQISNWFKNADQRGRDAYESENYEQAANEFADPMWQGAAHYKNGNYDAAIEAFSENDSAQSWYNRGNAYAQKGSLDKASKAYAEALQRQPDYPEASENKAIVDELMEQQQNQDQQQGNEQQQDKNQQQVDDQNQGDGSQQQQNDGQDDQQQSNEQDAQSQQDESSEGSESQNDDPKNQDNQNQDTNNQSDQQQGEQPQDSMQPQQSEQNDKQPPPDFSEQPQQATEQTQPDDMQQAVQNMATPAEQMTDEEREKQQQIDALLRRIPNDPAYLLQRKMQLEAQKRTRDRRPSSKEKQW